MDFDFMKSAGREDQMEMMMMQMAEIPTMEFSNIHQENNNIYDTNNNNNNNAHHVTSPTFMNLHQQPPSTISFSGAAEHYMHPNSGKRSSMAAMREMIFRMAAMQPIHIDPESVKPPKRRNVKISSDPQSVAARHRRERISERIRILQRLVPGGTKMDTASMLDEAIHYVKFLKNQVQSLERVARNGPPAAAGMGFPVAMSSGSGYFPVVGKGYRETASSRNVQQHLGD